MSTTEKTNSIIERLFEAGAHFGFSKSRRHPTVRPYLYGNKQGTDIFDLEKTAEMLAEAKTYVNKLGSEGKTLLFVGTKEEASNLVKRYAEKADAPYVTNRWIGGMLTNFQEIKKRIARLKSLTEEGESGELERKYTKKERVLIGRETQKLVFNFGGIRELSQTPQALLIVDPRHDTIALNEARDLGLPVVGIMSSDNDVDKVTFPVIVNDALQSSLDLILEEIVQAYQDGVQTYVPKAVEKKTHTSRTAR